MAKVTIKFALERETKGAVRYQEVGPDGSPRTTDEQGALIGTLYLRKKHLTTAGIKELPKSFSGAFEF